MNRQDIDHFLRTQSFGSGRALNTMTLALQKSGFKMASPAPKRWPRVRGPKAVRIDVTGGNTMGFNVQ